MEITSSISRKGGLLQFSNRGIKLVFPPNAVTVEHNIQVKIIPPSLSYEPTLLSSNSVVLQLLPNGLQLKREVSLTFTHCLTYTNEEKVKAKIYVSHHGKGQRPRWEERPLIPYIFHHSKCTVRLRDFCWLKVQIDDTEVEAKNLVVFAAKKILRNKKTAKVEIGYYEDIPERGEPNILKFNPDIKPEQSQLLKFIKEGKQPLSISFNGTVPEDTWYTEQGKAEETLQKCHVTFLYHDKLNQVSSRLIYAQKHTFRVSLDLQCNQGYLPYLTPRALCESLFLLQLLH
ncbi:hypothetical protein BSL78_03894 [Apostichopus japonicus]|uniref:ZU5 domain-containing protein n=1 Tax=Stichopus japonicus TaxID=307972 RepID=A0A2G8LG28_STIJA|nr:hypothetical protein BSL78_03894 [Apostichopus japonicus]